MKQILLTLALSIAVFIPKAEAVADPLPFLGSIRSEVLDQLTIASNNVAATNNVRVNKRLISILKGALRTIDRTKTNNFTGGARSLGALSKSLRRTALSNDFNPLIEGTLDVYVNVLDDIAEDFEDRLDAAYPGRLRNAAILKLAKLVAAIDSASTNTNIVTALRFLSAAAKNEALARKAVVRAENAPPPPSHFTATITGTGEGTVAFRPSPAAAVASRIGNLVTIIGVNFRLSGTTAYNKSLSVNIPNIVDGTTTYPVANLGGGNANVVYTTSTGGLGGPPSGDGFSATSGTLTVTINIAAKTAIGTFSFSAPGQNNPGHVAHSSNGSFSVVWQ